VREPFTYLYFVLASLLHLVATPFLLLLSLKDKYKEAIPARFFLVGNPSFAKNDLWFHVCSLGEARALKPLLELIKEQDIAITTITQTGHKEAQKYDAQVRYLPFESLLPFWIKGSKKLIVLEAEFWYLLFSVASARGAEVILLNARMTERSFPKYMKLRWFYARLFKYVDKVFCQSEADKERFELLGAQNIEVVGNIKLAQRIEQSEQLLKPDVETIVAASTHEGEELSILNGYLAYAKKHPSKLIVVPRHPERFDKVYAMLEKNRPESMTLSRWSDVASFESDIVLVDAMGMLNNIYAISDVAVLGGAFKSDVGGHNPLEPAHFGCKIITGQHAYMQQELFKYVSHVQIVESSAIESALLKAQEMSGSAITQSSDLERIVAYLKK